MAAVDMGQVGPTDADRAEEDSDRMRPAKRAEPVACTLCKAF